MVRPALPLAHPAPSPRAAGGGGHPDANRCSRKKEEMVTFAIDQLTSARGQSTLCTRSLRTGSESDFFLGKTAVFVLTWNAGMCDSLSVTVLRSKSAHSGRQIHVTRCPIG